MGSSSYGLNKSWLAIACCRLIASGMRRGGGTSPHWFWIWSYSRILVSSSSKICGKSTCSIYSRSLLTNQKTERTAVKKISRTVFIMKVDEISISNVSRYIIVGSVAMNRKKRITMGRQLSIVMKWVFKCSSKALPCARARYSAKSKSLERKDSVRAGK